MPTIRMKVDLVSLMEQASREMRAPGVTIGFAVANNYLNEIAKRAIELKDEQLIESCIGLGYITKEE